MPSVKPGSGVVAFARRPHHRRRSLLASGAALALLVKRSPQPADYESTDARRVAETDLDLGRVNVDVDLFERDVEEQSRNRVAIPRDQVAVRGAKGSDEQTVFHWPRIDEQELLVGHSAIEGRKADHSGQPQPVARTVDADAMTLQLVRQKLSHTRRRFGGLQREDPAALMVERERHVAASHRQPFHRVEARCIFGARRAQELAARRHLLEQPFDADARARRQGSRAFPARFTMIDFDPPAVRSPHPAFEHQPRDARNRRQRLAAEAEARHPIDGFVRQFRCGVPLKGEPHLVPRHSAAVVSDLD